MKTFHFFISYVYMYKNVYIIEISHVKLNFLSWQISREWLVCRIILLIRKCTKYHINRFFSKCFNNISCMNFFLLFFVSSIIYLILINKENLTGKQGMGYALHVLMHIKYTRIENWCKRQNHNAARYVYRIPLGVFIPDPPPLFADCFNGL